jgi:hypothetical protein
MSARASFKQADIRRMLRAAKDEGYPNPAVDKLPDGTLRLLTVAPDRAPASDEDLDLAAEVEAWSRKHGYD